MHNIINGRAVPCMSLYAGFALQTGLRLLVLIALDGLLMFRNNSCVQQTTVRNKEEAPRLTGAVGSVTTSNYSLLVFLNGRRFSPYTYRIRDGSDKVQGLWLVRAHPAVLGLSVLILAMGFQWAEDGLSAKGVLVSQGSLLAKNKIIVN